MRKGGPGVGAAASGCPMGASATELKELKELKERLRAQALALGFARCGFASTARLPHAEQLQDWLAAGCHGEMDYLARDAAERAEPRRLLAGAQSAIVCLASYIHHDRDEAPPATGLGRIARYARGPDYHRVLRERLGALDQWLRVQALGEEQLDGRIETRAAVDTSPLLERELAVAAGLGFIGKNTLLISAGLGSYTLIGTLLCSLRFEADPPAAHGCGACQRCLDSCPTAALGPPYRLDARRCISYLTIESRSPIPPALLPSWGDWVFGCDACQASCPFNRPTPAMRAAAPDPLLGAESALGQLPLGELVALRSGAYRRLVRGRALARTSRPSWIRNAEAVLAYQRSLSPRQAPGELAPPAEKPTPRRQEPPTSPVDREDPYALPSTNERLDTTPKGSPR